MFTTIQEHNICHFTEDELKELALQITFNIADAIDFDYIDDVKSKESLTFKDIFKYDKYDNDIKTIFDIYTPYILENMSFRILNVYEQMNVFPRLMVHFQKIIHIFKELNYEHIFPIYINNNLYKFEVFDKYPEWDSDFGFILCTICECAVDNLITLHNDSMTERK